MDHPDDPGGATNLGITQETLARYRGRKVSKSEVRALDRETAHDIYRRFYWDTLNCDELPAGLDLAVFDCGVNQGTRRAARFLQIALKVRVDGVIGPVTLRTTSEATSSVLLSEFMALRMRAYGRLSTLFRTFGLGWSRRLMATHSTALGLLHSAKNGAARISAACSNENSKPQDHSKESIMSFIIDRLREPSSFAGIAAFLAGVGIFGLSENEWNQVFAAVAAVAGVIAIFMRDGGAPTKTEIEKSDPASEASDRN